MDASHEQAATIPPFLVAIIQAFASRARAQAKEHWLNGQPWYRDLWARARDGSGLREQMAGEAPADDPRAQVARAFAEDRPQSPVQLYGSGGYSNSGLIEGGGGVKYTMPLTRDSSMSFFGGGGGAYGTIDTPIGRRDVHKFLPEVGLQYGVRF